MFDTIHLTNMLRSEVEGIPQPSPPNTLPLALFLPLLLQ